MGLTKKKWVYLSIIFLTIIDLLFIIYAIFYPVSSSFRNFIIVFDLFVCAVMWVEFIYSYRHSPDKRDYLKDNSISIIGMLPINFVFFRALRMVKLVQYIKLFVLDYETKGNISKFLKHTYLDKIILVGIIFVFLFAVLIEVADSSINSMQNALWYIIVSMTSTGYGDVVPTTVSGRIIGMIAMIGGIIIFATLTAVVSSLYVSKVSKDQHSDLESKIDELTSEIEKLNKKIDDLE